MPNSLAKACKSIHDTRHHCTRVTPVASFALSAAADTLGEFSAYYSATTNGIRGTAERHLVKLKENSYRLNVSLEAKLGGLEIGDLEQASEFSFTERSDKTANLQLPGVRRQLSRRNGGFRLGCHAGPECKRKAIMVCGLSTTTRWMNSATNSL